MFQPHLTEGLETVTGSCAAQWPLSQEQAELILRRAKPVALFGQGTWDAGLLELRQPAECFTNSRAASPPVPRQKI